MNAEKILAVQNRELRVLADLYKNKPGLFDAAEFKDRILRLANWSERAAKDDGESNFVEFTQFGIDSSKPKARQRS